VRQNLAGKVFGKEVVGLCLLFRTKSTVVTKSLATLVKFVSGDSSVIATLPLIGSIVLRKLLDDCGHSALDLPKHFTSRVRMQLSGLAGQPVIASLLSEICSSISSLQDSVTHTRTRSLHELPLVSDCNAVLAFLCYLCDNVQLGFEPEMRKRLFKRIDEEGWERGKGGVETGKDPVYDVNGWLKEGIHCPNLPKVRSRGRFGKDGKASEECCAREGGCDKPFAQGNARTGKHARDCVTVRPPPPLNIIRNIRVSVVS
jgi:hypothetical protein